MLVTIITDASHCDQTKAAGYGVWVASGRGSKAFDGPIKQAHDSLAAECMAVCNGLYHAITNNLVLKGDTILFQTDCMGAMQLFTSTRVPRGCEKEILQYFLDTTHGNGIGFRFKHVKGHSDVRDSRSSAQRKCDESAKKHMLAGRGRAQCDKLQKQIVDAKPSKKKPKKQSQDEMNESWVRKLKMLVRDATKVEFK